MIERLIEIIVKSIGRLITTILLIFILHPIITGIIAISAITYMNTKDLTLSLGQLLTWIIILTVLHIKKPRFFRLFLATGHSLRTKILARRRLNTTFKELRLDEQAEGTAFVKSPTIRRINT